MDPLFLYFEGNLPSDYKLKDQINNLSLTPSVYKSLENDILSLAFNTGGLVLANLDSIYNFSDTPKESMRYLPYKGKVFADISTGPRGGSEYWIWRNFNNIVRTSRDTVIESFRRDVDLSRIQPIHHGIAPIITEFNLERMEEWKKFSIDAPGLIGSTDPPRSLEVFLLRLQTIINLSSNNAWFFIALPDDKVIEEILQELQPYTQRLGVVRIVSSRFPWLVGLCKSKINLNVLEYKRKGPTIRFKNPLKGEIFYDLKQACLIWKIPFSLPEMVQ